MNTVLDIENLNVTLNNFELKDISFSLQKGCITGFIGVNGAGKTTTIKTILGLVLRDSGTIKIFEKNIDTHERELKNQIGIVMDNGFFYEEMTLNEMKNVIAPAYENWDKDIFNNFINQFSLDLNQKISTLSKGMKMKYAIALALSHHAKLLIMDEPTSGLDPLMRSELMKILLDFMREGNRSVFFSTHITSDLDKVADVLILIDKGRIILNREKDLVLETHALVKGDNRLLTPDNRKLFLTLNETRYGFKGITGNKAVLLEAMGRVITERPTIEDIMLAYTGGNNNVNQPY